MRGILLDVDGTLVLSNDAHAHSWVEAFAKYGYDLDFDDVRRLIGMGGDKLIPGLVPGLNKESGPGKDISQYRSRLFAEKYASNLKEAPGSRELVLRMRESGLRLLVASSANAEELQYLLKAAKVDDLLTEATTSSDAEQSKPDPDIIQAALEKIGLPASEVLMIGDTPYDIEAAGRSGVGLMAVRCGGWSDRDLEGALAVYDDPADLLVNYEQALR
jgi:HAD superfamily hydrolase (TIGR01509 family)